MSDDMIYWGVTAAIIAAYIFGVWYAGKCLYVAFKGWGHGGR